MIESRKISNRNQITDKKFGISFGIVFFIIAVWTWFKPWMPWWIPVLIGVAFFALAYTAPKMLHSLNQLWYWLGFGLQKITTPLILAIMFYLVLYPVSLLRHLFGAKGQIIRHTDKSATTYWVERKDKQTDFRRIF